MITKKIAFCVTLALVGLSAVEASAQLRLFGRRSRSQPNNVMVYSQPRVTAAQPSQVYTMPNSQSRAVAATKPATAVPHQMLKPVIGSVPTATTSLKTGSAAKADPFGLVGFEAEVIAQTNAQRARYGRAPLAVDHSLMSTSRAHAGWMARASSMQHGSYPVAENIAMGQRSATDALNSWMNSSGHRANILGGYRTIGVAAYTSGNGTIFWCQQFR